MSPAETELKVPGLSSSNESGSVASFVLGRLHEWGCERIYGYPGDGINGFLGAFREKGDQVKFTQTRHEEIAAFCASAHGKWTGGFGVCMATSGPGAIHLLNGLYDAHLDHVPAVAIVGQQARHGARRPTSSRRWTCTNLFKRRRPRIRPATAMRARRRRAHIDRPRRSASRSPRRAVTCLIVIPNDLQTSPSTRTRRSACTASYLLRHRLHQQAAGHPPAGRGPASRAADALNSRRKGGDAGRTGRGLGAPPMR